MSARAGELLALAASLAVGALVVWLLVVLPWLIAVIAGLSLLVSGAGLWLVFGRRPRDGA